MRANRAIFSIRAMCRVLEVSASGYYAWCSRQKSAREKENEKLDAVRQVHAQAVSFDQTAGAQKVRLPVAAFLDLAEGERPPLPLERRFVSASDE